MFVPSSMDILTLEYLQKSMPEDQLKKAEEVGAFDLLKASNLHPEVVTVHGKNGTYMAVRNKKNTDAPKEVGSAKNPMQKLKTVQAKKKAQKGTASKPETKPAVQPKPEMKAKPAVQPKPETKPEPKKAETKTKTAKKTSQSKAKKNTDKHDSTVSKAVSDAAMMLTSRFTDLCQKTGSNDAISASVLLSSQKWNGKLSDQDQIALKCLQGYGRQMYKAFTETAQKYGMDIAKKALKDCPAMKPDVLVIAASESIGKEAPANDLLAALDDNFCKQYVYDTLKKEFGDIASEQEIRDASMYTDATASDIKAVQAQYPSKQAMTHALAVKHAEAVTAEYVIRVQGWNNYLQGKKPRKSVKLQKAQRDAFEKLRFIPEQYGDAVLSQDELYQITKAYRPYADPHPHKAAGTIAKATVFDIQNLGKSLLDHSESVDETASKINPGRNKKKYDKNCQSCVVAYEARRRGFDVTAAPASYQHLYVESFDGAQPMQITQKYPNERQEAIEKQMAKWGDGARAIVEVRWKGRSSGHVFIAEQRDGRTCFIEPQVPSLAGTDAFVAEYMCDATNVRLVRVDNLPLTEHARVRCE